MYQIERRTIAKVCPNCKQQFAADDSLTHCPTDESLLSPVIEDPLIGSTIAGKYEILLLIGCGGWSMVYKAKHTSLNRLAAVKVLHAHLVSNPEKVKRFEYEAKAASGLVHNNIANVYDFGMLPNGQPYLVMDYLEGKSLSEVLRDEGNIGLNRALNIAVQAGSALAFAHSRGVIHRDFKPGNVMLMNSIYCKEVESRLTDLSAVAAIVSNQATTSGAKGISATQAVSPMRAANTSVVETTSTEPIFAPSELLGDQSTSADPIKTESVADQSTSADPIKTESVADPSTSADPIKTESVADQSTSADPIKTPNCADQATAANPANIHTFEQTTSPDAMRAISIQATSPDSMPAISSQATSPDSMPAISTQATSPEAIRAVPPKVTTAQKNTEVDLVAVEESASQHSGRAVVPARNRLKSFQAMTAKQSPLDDIQDQVQILDFGLAKLISEDAESPHLTKTGDTLGTPPYMSPEQCLGKKLDARSDIYSFGCVVYEMLTGQAAIEAGSAYECMHKHLNEMPRTISDVRPDLKFPSRLVNVVERSLAKDPADRYQDMQELLDDLESFRTPGKTVPVKGKRTPVRWKWKWRPRATEIAALAIIVMVGGTVIGGFLMNYFHVSGPQETIGMATESPEEFLREIEMARGRGDLSSAEKTAVRARDVMEKRFGKQSGQYAIALFLLAMVARDAGKHDEMVKNFELIYPIRSQFPPTQETVMALKEIGDYYLSIKQFEKADNLYGDALGLSERVFGPSHANHSVILHALGRVKMEQGKDKEALPYLNQAFSIEEKWLGPMNPQVARLAFDLAKLNERLGYVAAAETMYKHSLDLQAGLFGPMNPHSAETLQNYADLLDKSGRKQEAKKLRAEANAMKSAANKH